MSTSARTAIVTGGCTGIGLGIVRALLAGGYAVTATALTESERAAGVAAVGAPQAGAFDAVLLDVRDSAAVNALGGRFARLDALVNNAGIGLGSPAEQEETGFATVVDVNLHGVMRMCFACRPALVAARGAVVNIASILSIFGSGNAPGYSASKGAVAQLTKSLAIAWAADGVRVNAIAPGWIETALTDPVRAMPGRSDMILARTPMRRWGTPADIAGVARFLLSAEAGFMTGALVPVDGGYSAF
ncbi:MAG: SDR family oxidoreductase [Burkholderiales bacterium]|nr:SDR family oxidoreductase [Burkholderiales bacterium]